MSHSWHVVSGLTIVCVMLFLPAECLELKLQRISWGSFWHKQLHYTCYRLLDPARMSERRGLSNGFADDVVMRSVTTCFFSYCVYTKATGMQLMATTRFCSSRWWSSSGKEFNLCAHFFVFVQRYICCLFTTLHLWVDLQLPLTRSLQYRVKEILFSDSASPCCAYVIQLINVSWVERHRDGNDCVCLQLKWVIIWNVLESACRPECRSCCCEFYAWRLLLP